MCHVPLFFVTLKFFRFPPVQMNLLLIVTSYIDLSFGSISSLGCIFQIDMSYHFSPRWHSSDTRTSLENVKLHDHNSRCRFYIIPVSAWKLNLVVGNKTTGDKMSLGSGRSPYTFSKKKKKPDGKYPSECPSAFCACCSCERKWCSEQAMAHPAYSSDGDVRWRRALFLR